MPYSRTRFGTSRFAGWFSAAVFGAMSWATPTIAAQTPADLVATSADRSSQAIDHSAWGALLGRYVKPGADGINRVDYAAFKAQDHQALKDYVRKLEQVDPQQLDKAGQFAFLANLYNAKTVDIVLDHYPVKSIKDISLGGGLVALVTGGPWKAKVLKIQGVELSLDDIEHGILRPVFKDPRVHYAVNCASIGCPNLPTEPFTGAQLEAQLDTAARAYVNHPRGANVSGSNLVVSSIFEWFKEDFGDSDTGVVEHLRRFAAPELKRRLEPVAGISGHAYDWNLNDTAGGPSR